MAELITLSRAQRSPNLSAVSKDLLEDLIPAASQAVEDWCSRKFAMATYDELYDGDGTNNMLLRVFPVSSITSVRITDQVSGLAYDLVAADFILDKRTGELTFNPSLSSTAAICSYLCGKQNVQVVYVAGFNPIPPVVQAATVEVLMSLVSDHLNDPNMKSERLGDYSYTSAKSDEVRAELPASARRLLSRYRDKL